MVSQTPRFALSASFQKIEQSFTYTPQQPILFYATHRNGFFNVSHFTCAENKEYTDLSFLTEEQQQLYETACEIGFGLYGMGSNLMNLWGYRPVTNSEGNDVIVMENYTLYDVAYDDFSDQIHQIFTDNCLATTDYTAKFIDYHGSLAVDTWMTNDLIEGTTRQVLEDAPDTYRLIRSTEDEMAFTLISHYDRDWNVSADMNVFTVEYPIRMVNTASGWRIDEFHTTMYG